MKSSLVSGDGKDKEFLLLVSAMVVLGLIEVRCRDCSSLLAYWLMTASCRLHWEILVGISCRLVALVENLHFVPWLLAFKADDTDRLREDVEVVIVGSWHH